MPDLEDRQLPLFSENSSRRHPSETPFSKYIVYVDESGDHSMEKIDNQYPLFVLVHPVKRFVTYQAFDVHA